jgi:signal transduction histidine kinase
VLREHGIKLDIDCPTADGNAAGEFPLHPPDPHRETPWTGSARPTSRASAEDFDDVCQLLFADNGPGIPAGVGNRIFHLFSRKEAGRGMGLTIARQLLETYSGSIDILPEAGTRGRICW